MISAEMLGRLGNQMFVAAATHSLALDNKDEAVFPNSISGITPTDRETMLHRKTIFRKLKYTDDLSFIEWLHAENTDHTHSPIEYKDNLFLKGYFQSEKYFKHNRNAIIELFEPLKQIDDFLERKYSDLIKNKKAVSVHIRRGDYLQLQQYHVIIGKEYYEEAKKQFDKDSVFVYFSDDINWCKDTFKGDNSIFIEKQDDILDMYLMSKITNNIIANSSFSWWAAWLNKNEDKQVICPSNWFGPENRHLDVAKKDLIPKEWKVI